MEVELYECVRRLTSGPTPRTTLGKWQSLRDNAEQGTGESGYRISSWLVSGLPNGKGTVGTIGNARASSGTYTAPARVPPGNGLVTITVGTARAAKTLDVGLTAPPAAR